MNWQDVWNFEINFGLGRLAVHTIVVAVLLIAVSILVARLLQAWLSRIRMKSGAGGNPTLYVAERIGFYFILAMGVLIALSVAGINLSSLSIFAGALGVGLGLGLQQVVRNFLSGVTLLLDRSLGPGDFIELEGGVTGEVVEVGSRATRLVTNDNVDVMVPNAQLLDGRVINWTRGGGTRRVHVPFNVAYGSDKEKVRAAALEAAREVPFTLPDDGVRRTQVWLTKFADSALEFELVVWPSLEAVKRPGAMYAAYNWAIEDALRRHRIDIPFPQTDVHLRTFFGAHGETAREAWGRGVNGAAPSGANDARDELLEPPPTSRLRAE